MVMDEDKVRRRRKAARPSEILAAAVAVFSEQGFAKARISDIAKRAGIAKGTVYLYYETKAKLFEAIVNSNIKPVFMKLDQFVAAWTDSTEELLKHVILNAYQQLITKPERRVVMKIIIAEGSQFPELTQYYYETIMANARPLLRRIIEKGIATGEFRETKALEQPQVIMGPAFLAGIWLMTFQHIEPLDIEAHSQAHLALIFNGLKASS